MRVPNPWQCCEKWVNIQRGDEDYDKVYNEKRMNFLQYWFENCVANDSRIKKLHEEQITLIRGQHDLNHSVHQAKFKAIFENLKACVIKACEKKTLQKKIIY